MSYMTLSSQEKHLFLLFSYFRAHPKTLLLKILGGRMHGSSPHLKLWGTVPPVPLGFRLCLPMFHYFVILSSMPQPILAVVHPALMVDPKPAVLNLWVVTPRWSP